METTKIKVVKSISPEGIAELTTLELQKLGGFASTIIFANSEFISFIYYHPRLENERPTYSGKMKNPNAPLTDKQRYKLGQLGYKKDTSRLTKLEASKLIDELG